MTWFKRDLDRWIPGVSRKMIWPSGRFLIPRRRLRVVWGLLETMASFWPRSRLRSVDLPALGRPIRAIKPDLNFEALFSFIGTIQIQFQTFQRILGGFLLRLLFAFPRSDADHFFPDHHFHAEHLGMIRAELFSQKIAGGGPDT